MPERLHSSPQVPHTTYSAETAADRFTRDGIVLGHASHAPLIAEFDRRLQRIVATLNANLMHLAVVTPEVDDLTEFAAHHASATPPQVSIALQRHLHDVCARGRAQWRMQNSRYYPSRNGLYPLRTVDGKVVHIRRISQTSLFNRNSPAVKSDGVMPYIRKSLGEAQRAALYDEKLVCRPLTANDVSPTESALIGQRGVFAARALATGECIGVYGGTLLQGTHANLARNSGYMLHYVLEERSHPAMRGDFYQALDGDTILSRINTRYRYDANGRPNAQAGTGYNVRTKTFHVAFDRSTDPYEGVLHAVFTTEAVAPGTELRLNYNYDPAAVKQSFDLIEAANAGKPLY